MTFDFSSLPHFLGISERSCGCVATIVSYQNESFSSKWDLPCLPPSSLELWRRERASRQLSFWWKTLNLIGHYSTILSSRSEIVIVTRPVWTQGNRPSAPRGSEETTERDPAAIARSRRVGKVYLCQTNEDHQPRRLYTSREKWIQVTYPNRG